MRFGISTHLYHEQRLQQEHLREIAAHGFETIEVFATRSHFDYRDPSAIQALAQWLREAGLTLHSVHAPITDVFAGGKPGRLFSTATRDNEARRETLAEIASALDIARTIPFHFLVVHLGIPDALKPGPEQNNVDAALRSVEEIHRLAGAAGARVALEIMGNSLSTAPALVDLIDRSFDDVDLGICMDVGHAHLLGDVADAIETSGEYLFTTHIHDNRRMTDDHLVPFRGSINWAGTIMAFEKIGYDGVLMYEVTSTDPPVAVLDSAVNARRRLEALLAASSQMPADDSL